MLLLRHCHIPRLDHLARSVEPTLLSEAMSIQDFQSRKTFVHLLGETFVDDQVWKQACLPIRMGGFGLTPLSSIAGPAFVALWSHTISELPSRFPHLKVIMDKFTCDASSPVGHAFRSYLPTNKKISDYKRIKKLQHQLSISNFKEDFQHLVDAAPTARDEARFRSLQGKSAGAWLHALPTSYSIARNPCEFCLACRLRLGLPITISKWVESCNCNALLDDSGYHLLTCKTGGGPIWSHESIAVWLEYLRSLRIHHCREPRNRYTNSGCRPDIIMFNAESGANIDLDISLAHPWSSDVFPSSAEATGVAANRRETRKMAKYEQHNLPGGSVVKVVPLVMEHFESWGEEARKFLQKLTAFSSDEAGRPNAVEFLDFWRKRFSVQLQKCNVKVIAKKLSMLCGGSERPDSLLAPNFFLVSLSYI